MRSEALQQERWEHRFDPHVALINQLVDDLIEEPDGSWMPYIPAYHGGIESEIVLLYQDPNKMTAREHGGSGFLGAENDDGSAQLVAECMRTRREAVHARSCPRIQQKSETRARWPPVQRLDTPSGHRSTLLQWPWEN